MRGISLRLTADPSMAFFGPRKSQSRSARAASLTASTSWWRQFCDALSNRGVLIRLTIAAVGIVGFLVAVAGWRTLFPYRLGDRVEHGISARVDFRVVNRAETDRHRSEREALVPFVFVHDPEPLKGLPARLRNHLGDVSEADTLADLSSEARAAFGFKVDVDDAEAQERVFLTLKTSMSGGDSEGKELDQIVSDFEAFLEPVRRLGVVDDEDLDREELAGRTEAVPTDHTVEIIRADGGPSETATVADVQLAEMVKNTGQLGKYWSAYPGLSEIRGLLETWLINEVPVTLRFDSETTLAKRIEARENAGEKFDSYSQGARLVEPGRAVDEETLRLLQAEYDTLEESLPLQYRVLRSFAVLMMFVVLGVLFGTYLVRSEPAIVTSALRLSVFLGLCVSTVWLARVVSFDPWRAEVIPLLATVIILGIAYNQVLAILTAFVLSMIISLSTVAHLDHFVVLMAVCVAGVIPMRGVSSRSALIKTGFVVAGVYVLISWASAIVSHQAPVTIWEDTSLLVNSLRGAGWCLVCCYLVAGTLPFIESWFGLVTDISLLELGDVSHPLLQELVRRAPGTYNHSISVASIGEAAAEAIGANGLLVRVGAYFHDIGKMLKPEYFIENSGAGTGSRHESLAPAMSTLIIIGHVKDGVELANEHNLPRPIVDFIEQHHGTTLVEYFFHEAARQSDKDHLSNAEEASYRYPGPKPQSREAGVMMLADAVESASRTLSEPTPRRIESLVHEITMKRLLDGQFDDCALTLSQIRTVENSLIKSLIAIYHGRVKYPEQQTA